MKILITGGTGFLGRNAEEAFANRQHSHELFFAGSSDADLTKEYQTAKLFNKVKPDVVIHLAALAGGIGLNSRRPADLTTANVLMAAHLYQEAVHHKVKKIYAMSSCCAYAETAKIPEKEDELWEGGAPEKTNKGYGVGKRLLGIMSEMYRKQYGIGGTVLIPANLFGLYDSYDWEDSHVIPALIRKFVTAKLRNRPTVELWGNGTATREFLFAGDLAETIVDLVLADFDYPEPINIGTEQEISIKDLANKIAYLVGFEGSIIWDGRAINGQPRRKLCLDRARELFNYTPKTSLDDGLKKTIDWYTNHIYPNQD